MDFKKRKPKSGGSTSKKSTAGVAEDLNDEEESGVALLIQVSKRRSTATFTRYSQSAGFSGMDELVAGVLVCGVVQFRHSSAVPQLITKEMSGGEHTRNHHMYIVLVKIIWMHGQWIVWFETVYAYAVQACGETPMLRWCSHSP